MVQIRGIGRAWWVLAACALLASCGSGSTDSGGGTTTAATPSAPAQAAVLADGDAARLAKQATFGPTADVVARIKALGVSAWLDEQFAATGSSYADIASAAVVQNYCATGDSMCSRHYFSREPMAMRFYADALAQPDQLRQRVAFALSQLIVASHVEVTAAAGSASLNQIFLSNAFGNYRDILMKVTLNGYMGDYLDMADSNKTAPSENYAREMLQLFAMGPDQLNMNGTPVTDSTGATTPTYTQDDVHGVARALTGWTYARLNGAAITDSNARDYSQPMVQVAARYDTTAKTFFGTTVPAGASQTDSVAAAVDAAFNNSSTAPYIAKYMIQQLVTSNPSTAYVQRVASVFANNGSNVRGDMKAMVRAILTDAEARGAVAPTTDNYGKVKEPVLLLTSIARAVGMTGDGYVFSQRDAPLGEAVFNSPSVFNFYPPDYPLAGSTTLVSPPSKLLTTSTVVARHNNIYDWTISGLSTRGEFAVNSTVTGSTGTTIDWSGWTALDVDAMIDRIDLIMLNRTMTAAQKAALKAAANAITNTDPTVQARTRAQTMIYIVGASPLFQVDR